MISQLTIVRNRIFWCKMNPAVIVLFFQFRACNISILAKRAQWMLMKDYSSFLPVTFAQCIKSLYFLVVGPWRQQLWWCWSQVILLSKDKGYFYHSIKSKLYSWNLCSLWLSLLSSDCGYVFMKRCIWLIQTRISEIAVTWVSTRMCVSWKLHLHNWNAYMGFI